MKTATLNLRISPSLKEGVKKAANIEHRSIANMIEMLIRRHCDDYFDIRDSAYPDAINMKVNNYL